MEYSHIEICLKFENPGNYFINVFNGNCYNGWFQFYVKIKKTNEEKCVFKLFKKISDFDKIVLESLRHKISIKISETNLNDIEDGQMNVYNEGFYNKYPNSVFVAKISPLIDDGSYEFYLDSDGITRENI